MMAQDIRRSSFEPIAIVGFACRLPGGVRSPSALWKLLSENRSAQGPVPKDRFNIDAYYNPGKPASLPMNGGYFLGEDIRAFDAGFFGFRDSEAATLDLQQRQLLEVTYECLENCGLTLQDMAGSQTGCYIGSLNHDFADEIDLEYPPPYAWSGTGATTLSNRLSYFYDLKGPSLTVDTACSASLYAIHLACNALATGEAEGAIVGGSNTITSVNRMIAMASGGVLSPDGTCHTFDARANGYGRAEGVGAVYLTTVSSALSRNLPIRSIIRGSAINANGRTAGITHPDENGQIAAIRAAYVAANLDPCLTSYLECHGTGTKFGDVVETTAISKVFKGKQDSDFPLYIGSIKSNLGHSEPTSGLSGLMKCVLALERGVIPAHHGLQVPNPKIDFGGWNLRVPSECMPWPANQVRRASLNSFGYGGSNAHTIIESTHSFFTNWKDRHIIFKDNLVHESTNVQSHSSEEGTIYGGRTTGKSSANPFLLVFSAQNEQSLRENVRKMGEVSPGYAMRNLAYTLGQRRSHLSHRAYCVAFSGKPFSVADITINRRNANPPNLCFVFTGQGAIWDGLGRSCFKTSEAFQRTIEALDESLATLGEHKPTFTLNELLSNTRDLNVQRPDISQTLCTAVQIAIVDLIQEWGVVPKASVGHSSGEIAAAYAAGYISKHDAIKCAYLRGLAALKAADPGAMIAVHMTKAEIEELLRGYNPGAIDIACENSPGSYTLAGSHETVKDLKRCLTAQCRLSKVIETGGMAYHSQRMIRAAEMYAKLMQDHLSGSREGTRKCRFISSVYAREVQSEEVDRGYWKANLLHPVRFTDALSEVIKDAQVPIDILVEIGPHPILQQPIQDILAYQEKNLASLRTLVRHQDGAHNLLQMAGELFIRGYPVIMGGVNASSADTSSCPKLIVDLPTYSWDHSKTHMPYYRVSQETRFRTYVRHDLLGSSLSGLPRYPRIWRNFLRLTELPWLREHKVGGQIVFPFTGYLSMAVEAARQVYGGQTDVAYELSSLHIDNPLVLSDQDQQEIILSLAPLSTTAKDIYEFTISTPNHDASIWTEHLKGTIAHMKGQDTFTAHERDVLQMGHERPKSIGTSDFYLKSRELGFDYGPTFSRLENIVVSEEGIAKARLPCGGRSSDVADPATLDMALHLGLPALHHGLEYGAAYIPVSAKCIRIWPCDDKVRKMDATVTTHAKAYGLRDVTIDSQLSSCSGTLRCSIIQMRLMEIQLVDKKVEPSAARTPYNQVVYKPDVGFLRQLDAERLYPPRVLSAENSQYVQELDIATLSCIQDLLAKVDDPKMSSSNHALPGFMKNYLDWMRKRASDMRSAAICASGKLSLVHAGQIEKRLSKIPLAEAQLVLQLWRGFEHLYNGSKAGIDLLTANGSWNRMFDSTSISAATYVQARRLIGLLAHQNPNMKILEVGAGTGGLTAQLLDELGGNGLNRMYDSYTFTDISPAFFAPAQARFKDFAGVDYKTFDLEVSVRDQGFLDEQYDLIVASNVLHATSNLKRTLKSLMSLLAPNGHLLFGEVAKGSEVPTSLGFVMGCLPGWWQSTEDYRSHGPLLSKCRWIEVLRESGFETKVVLPDFAVPYTTTEIFCACKIPAPPSETCPTLMLLHGNEHGDIPLVVAEAAQRKGYQVVTHNISTDAMEICASGGDIFQEAIFVDKIEGSVLSRLEDAELSCLQEVMRRMKRVVWLTSGGLGSNTHPEAALVAGLARAIREESAFELYTLDVDLKKGTHTEVGVETIDFLEGIRNRRGPSKDYDFVLKDRILHTWRLYEDHHLNENFRMRTETSIKQGGSIQQTPLMADLEHFGSLSSLYFKEDTSRFEVMSYGQVEIDVHVIGMNFKDVMTALGRVRGSTCLSHEGAGIITRTGPGVTTLKAGDRVVAFGKGNYGNLMRARQTDVMPLQAGESYSEMASRLTALTTALYCLKYLLFLRSGQSVLIHAAAGGLGLAAIQIAQYLGATVYATVGSQPKKNYLMKNFNIPEAHIFDSRSIQFASDLMAATDGKGVNAILTSAAGAVLDASMRCLRPLGRLVSLGVAEAQHYGRMDMGMLNQSRSFLHCNIAEVCEHDPDLMHSVLQEAFGLYRKVIASVMPVKEFQLTALEEAMRYMTKGTHIGKVVIAVQPKPEAPFARVAIPKYDSLFEAEKSYLLVGCLGGVGQAIAKWMCSRGARKLIFLSRSGSTSDISQFIAKLSAQEVESIVLQGDVSNTDDVRRAIKHAKYPIKGVIHAAMVLDDALFDSMTTSKWHNALRPKVEGALSLHEAFSAQHLDFFVVTSSIAGIFGVTGQGGYSAANAFLDGFSKWRSARGQPTVSINLPVVDDIGYVAQRPELHRYLTTQGGYGAPQWEILQMLDRAISRCVRDGDSLRRSPGLAQISGGFEAVRLQQLEDQGYYSLLASNRQPQLFPVERKMKNMRAASKAAPVEQSTTEKEQSKAEILQVAKEDVVKARSLVCDKLLRKLAGTLAVRLEDMNPRSRLAEYGVDSLSAADIRGWFMSAIGVELPVLEILMQSNTLADLARLAVEGLIQKNAYALPAE